MKNDLRLIGQSLHVDDLTRHNPNMMLLNNPHLETDPIYKSLKTDLESYYTETQKPAENPIKKEKTLKSALYTNLHSLLSEVAFTKDTNIQQKMLKTVHNWFIKKTNGKNKLPYIRHGAHGTSVPPQSATPILVGSSSVNEDSHSSLGSIPNIKKHYQSVEVTLPQAVCLDQKYLSMRNQEYSASKEASNRNNVIFAWGSEKSRANEDYITKIEQSRIGSKNKRSESPDPIRTSNRKYTAKIPSNHGLLYNFSESKEIPETPPIREKNNLSRINKIRQLNSSLIDIDSEFQLPKNKKNESSMSMYRGYDSFYESKDRRAKSSEKFNEQINEVMIAKKKLASRDVACPIKFLINGLVLAEDSVRSVSPDILPRGGEYLINNPLLKLGKKKKKKGKKKGKKSKKK